jgi:hypothetical protein
LLRKHMPQFDLTQRIIVGNIWALYRLVHIANDATISSR